MAVAENKAATILIVDDTPDSLTVLADLLHQRGYSVRPAINGELALKAACKAPPDLILLDILMPGMDGFEVCRQLKADPRTAQVPVIFISARDEMVDMVEAFKLGGVDYITKPFTPEVVIARVQTHLNTGRLQAALQQQNIQLQHEIAERKASEEKLRISELRYRSILEASPDPTVIYDPEGRTLYVNPGFEKLYGWSPEELHHKRIDFVPEDELESTRKAWERTLAGENIQFETKRLNKRGQILNIELRTAILTDDHGRHTASIVIHRNITRQKEAERELRNYRDHLEELVAKRTDALRQSEEKYRNVLETSPDPIVAYDSEGRAIYINPSFSQVFGWTFDEVRGKKIDYVPEAEVPITQRMIEKIKNEERLIGFETRRLTKSGKLLDISMNGAVFRGGDGRQAGSVVMLRDVTERKQAETRLKESEEKFRNLFESAPEGIIITTLSGEILSFNRAFSQILKYSSPDDLKRLNISGIYVNPERDRPAMLAKLQAVGQLENYEVDFKDALGKPFNASLSLRMIKYEQKTCIQTILRDVTHIKKMEAKLKSHTENLEQRVAERTTQLEAANRSLEEALVTVGKMVRQAQAANEAKSIFLANMSHELRPPLNAILGYAQLLSMRYRDNPDLSNRLGTIQQSGEHLLTLINDILDLSKIEAGRLDLYPTVLRLPDFLEGIANIASSRAHAKNLVCRLEMDPHLPLAVQADETRLRQVLLNLMGNAIKFTDHGEVCLRVRNLGPPLKDPSRGQPASAQLRFEVHDTGSGIAADQLLRIFAPFEQVGDVSRRAEGTGLGLTISRRLVQMMGGDLQAQSPTLLSSVSGKTEGRPGSTFWFEINLALAVSKPGSDLPSVQTIMGYFGQRRKVLVVDDIESNRAMVINLLEPLGFELAQACNGEQAIRQARTFMPDLVLLDLRMPGLDGWQMAKQIRRFPQLRNIRIIAISASVSKQDRSRSKSAGIDDFLPKPIQWRRLAQLLEDHLELQWQFGQAQAPATPAEPQAVEAPARQAPPREELEALYELARMGKINHLLHRLRSLQERDKSCAAFVEKLASMAGRYKIKQIQTFLTEYLDSDA